MVQASAPGKCILFGEHAVVYGQPAVAVAIDQRMSVDLALNDDWRIDGMSFHPQKRQEITEKPRKTIQRPKIEENLLTASK